MRSLVLVAFLAFPLGGSDVLAQESEEAVADPRIAEVQQTIDSYSAAYQGRDAGKLASHWSPEGIYLNGATGDEVVGREAIAAEFKTLFAGDDVPRVVLETESIDLVSPNVALERGMSIVTSGDNEPVRSNYRVIYVKRDGKWLIDRVTEDGADATESHEAHLEGLAWIIGSWSDDGDDFTIESNCNWTRNRNFISRTYKVETADGVESAGLQIIGWDAADEQIRSWLFDSNGGVITGVWSDNDGQWTVQSVAKLADGGKGSFTSVFRPIDDSSYGWRKINRVVDGRLMPNIDEVIVRRK